MTSLSFSLRVWGQRANLCPLRLSACLSVCRGHSLSHWPLRASDCVTRQQAAHHPASLWLVMTAGMARVWSMTARLHTNPHTQHKLLPPLTFTEALWSLSLSVQNVQMLNVQTKKKGHNNSQHALKQCRYLVLCDGQWVLKIAPSFHCPQEDHFQCLQQLKL